MFLIERIARHLVTHGICSTKDLALALDETAARVGDAIKAERNRARWGITKMPRDDDHHSKGGAPNLWQINVRVFQRYLVERRDMPWVTKRLKNNTKPSPKPSPKPSHKPVAKPPKVAKQIKLPKEATIPAANRPVYEGPILTRWQPSSPYYFNQPKENR